MEQKIYERQVTKLATSKRVIDKHQIDRHYRETDLAELYKYNIQPEEARPQMKSPADDILKKLLPDKVYKYHKHDSLLKNKSVTLAQEEVKVAVTEKTATSQVKGTSTNSINTSRQPVSESSMQSNNRFGAAKARTSSMYRSCFGFKPDDLQQLLWARTTTQHPDYEYEKCAEIVEQLFHRLRTTMAEGDTSVS